jgi:hypothetical protein
MPIKNLTDFEILLKDKVAFKLLNFFLRRWGLDVYIIREKDNAERQKENAESVSSLTDSAIDVYGEFSGISPALANPLDLDPDIINVKFTARVLFTQVLANPYDAAASGDFEEQVIYTFDDITTNDRIELTTDTGSKKYYLVMEPQVVGKTIDIYKKFKVVNVGE